MPQLVRQPLDKDRRSLVLDKQKRFQLSSELAETLR